ncbi:MAG: PAS domain-containing sensor histidine kinase [Proteobacteria bacterium]|nr:PAS domain-containing sensor histidine kinase [Pseudomonadota bacterium]
MTDLASLNCGRLRVDPSRRIEDLNPALAAWRGLPTDHLLGRDLGVLISRGSLVYWETAVEALLEQQGYAWDLSLELRAEAGDRVAVLVNARRDDGVTDCLFFPYAERRRYERQILEAEMHAKRQAVEIERLEAIDAFQRDFINTAAHELATPMTPLKLQLYMVKKALQGEADPKLQHALEVMETNIGRLSKLTSSLLASARVEAGHIGVRLDRVDLHQALPKMVETWRREHAPERDVQVEAHEGTIRADPEALESCLAHLLENAVKFSQPGSSIRVQTMVGPRVQVSVVDEGRGIDPARLHELGRPFAQVHDRTEVTALGVGLGLHIVAGLMNAQGGRLVVQSEGRGKGTTATLEFPGEAEAGRPVAPAVAVPE